MPTTSGRGAGAVTVATPTDLGALVREAREGRGWTQTALGARIGASRFWVAEFERGKAGVELGLALRAAAAVGLTLRVARPGIGAPTSDTTTDRDANHASPPPAIAAIDLDAIVGTTADLHVR